PRGPAGGPPAAPSVGNDVMKSSTPYRVCSANIVLKDSDCRAQALACPTHRRAMTAPDQPARPSRAPMSGRAIVQSQFDRAADLINLEAYMRKILMSPFRGVQVEVPVRMADGP